MYNLLSSRKGMAMFLLSVSLCLAYLFLRRGGQYYVADHDTELRLLKSSADKSGDASVVWFVPN
jgi:hypothetical protein